MVLIAGLFVLRRVLERKKNTMDNLELEYEDASSFDTNGVHFKALKTRRTFTPIET